MPNVIDTMTEKGNNMPIPRKIWTFWFGEEMPEGIKKCIASQRIPGYEHFVLTEKNFLDDSPTKMANVPEYIKVALANKKFVKATDYARAWLLYTYGGIALDADVTILPNKNFDDLLHVNLFASREENGFIGYSTVGSKAGHPLWEEYFKQVNEKFSPLDGLNFESSMEIFTYLMYARSDVTILSPDYFFVYNWQTGIINVTENSIALHDFWKSWKPEAKDLLPTVSIIIPQLGREEGLKRCLDSIDRLYYPKHLIEVLIEEGDETVPIKVKKGFERSKGDVIVYAANDMEFTPQSLYEAVRLSRDFGLVAFNAGEVLPDRGNICEHFLITKKLATELGEIFDTEFHHVGVDNLLWARAEKRQQSVRAEKAIIHHHHFSKREGEGWDLVYDKGWSETSEDRELLKNKLKSLN